MIVSFDLNSVTFHCKHPKCGEIFEKSLSDLAGADRVFCPRCGTAARIGEGNHLLAAAIAPEEGVRVGKTTR